MRTARALVLALGLVGLLSACGIAEIVAVVNFDLRIDDPNLTVARGGEEELSVDVVRMSPIAPDVTLTLEDPPAGVSAESVVVPGSASNGIMKIKVSAEAAVQTHTITVKGAGTPLVKTASFSLEVSD